MITVDLSKIMIQTLKVQTCFQSILCIFMYPAHIFTLFISIDSIDLFRKIFRRGLADLFHLLLRSLYISHMVLSGLRFLARCSNSGKFQ